MNLLIVSSIPSPQGELADGSVKFTITQKTLGIQEGNENVPESTTVITITITQSNKPRSAAVSSITTPVLFMILGLVTSETIPPEVVPAFVLCLCLSLVVKFVQWAIGRLGERGRKGSVV